MEEQKKLTYFKMYIDDLHVMEECFTEEQSGILVLALGEYVEFGEARRALPPELKPTFTMMINKIKGAQDKYAQKCVTLAKNGAKGGRKKAENAATDASTDGESERKKLPKFKPPTKTEFKAIISEFRKNEYIQCSDYEADELYSTLDSSSWVYDGYSITTREEVKIIVAARFMTYRRMVGKLILAQLISDGKLSEFSAQEIVDFVEDCLEMINGKPAGICVGRKHYNWTAEGISGAIAEWLREDDG